MLTETKNKWIDENLNSWDKKKYSEEDAIRLSETLSNCSYCSDCSNCSNCSYCSNCSDCSNCSSCSYCSYCSDCSNCSYCSYCSYCSDCSDFKENPERIYSSKIGSRKSNTKVYFNSEKTLVVCGCFCGSLKEFEERVNTVHEGTVYQKEYNNFIEKVKKYIST
jgi:hypothetical protein